MHMGDVTGEIFREEPLRVLSGKDFFQNVYRELTLVGYPIDS